MMKNLMLAAAATVGLFGASELTSQARADNWNLGINFGRPGYPTYYPPAYYPPSYYPRPPIVERDDHYHVEYRAYRFGPWMRYGTYDSHGRAHAVEDRLERQGYDARVVHH